MNYVYLFTLPLIIAFVSTPLIARFALYNGFVDEPGGHKMHDEAKPLLGGLSIFLACAVTLLWFYPFTPRLLSVFGGGLLLVAVGVLDDLYDFKPLHKLAGQLAAASIAVLFNIGSYEVLLSFFQRLFIPEFVVLGLIIGWIALMINAFNLIDGMDGLSAGTAAIIFGSMAVISFLQGSQGLLGAQLVGLAACLGFLPYNFNPARIFMGDAGSMLLGYLLAVTHLYSIAEPFSAAVVLGSLFIFAYPALDVSFAIYRRLRHRVSIFKADRGHIHHVLQRMGFSVRKTVSIIYLANLLFGGMAVLVFCLSLPPLVIIALGIMTLAGIYFLFSFLYRQGRRADASFGGTLDRER